MASRQQALRIVRNSPAMLRKAEIPGLDDERFGQYFHGPDGLFSSCALDRGIISAVERPIAGLADLLPVYATTNASPLYGTLTAHNKENIERPDGPCDPSPSGNWSACTLSSSFGRFSSDTEVYEIDRMILDATRGDTRDFRLLVDSLLGASALSPSGINESDMLNMIVQATMVSSAINLEDDFINNVFMGDPANNTAGGGYKEFRGLDLQINTGILDAETGDPCPALDSIVGNWDYTDVCGVAGADATLDIGATVVDITGYNLYRTLQAIEYQLHMRSRHQRSGNVEHVIAVRPQLWQWMSSCLPCQWETEHCTVAGGGSETIFVDGARQFNEQLRLQSEMKLRINGRWYPVVEDEGIRELNNTTTPGELAAGQYASHLYFIPLSIRNGTTPVTFVEHLDYSKITREFQGNAPLDFINWTDDGRFAWVGEQTKFCWQLTGKVEPRLILRTPQLAAKLLNIRYTDF